MARITNDEILTILPNKYELSVIASQRVRDLFGGADSIVDKNNDKLEVIALKEIATGKLDINYIKQELIASYSTDTVKQENTEEEEESADIKAIEEELNS